MDQHKRCIPERTGIRRRRAVGVADCRHRTACCVAASLAPLPLADRGQPGLLVVSMGRAVARDRISRDLRGAGPVARSTPRCPELTAVGTMLAAVVVMQSERR